MSFLVNWLESMDLEMKITDRCLRQRNDHSTCIECLQQCKQNALSIVDNLVVLDIEKCTLCGRCITECPLSAIQGIPANRIFENESLHYDESYTPTIKELLIYKKRGISSIQTGSSLDIGEWKEVLNNTNHLLLNLGEEIISVQQVKSIKLSRRSFFSEVRKKSRKLAKEIAPANWKVSETDWILSKYYPKFQFFDVIIDKSKCIVCKGCISVCPQGVYSIDHLSQIIDNTKCVNCGLCADICPESAIEITPKECEKKENIIVFMEKECEDCGRIFYTFQQEKDVCFVCSYRESDWLKP